MWQLLIQYLTVFAWSGLKFLVGVGFSIGFQLGWFEQFLLTFLGGTLGTTVFTLFGVPIRRWVKRQWAMYRARRGGHTAETETENKPSRFRQWVTRRFGVPGIAFFTPPLLSPPIGTAMALALGAKPRVVIAWMAVGMFFWSALFAAVGQPLIDLIHVATPELPTGS